MEERQKEPDVPFSSSNAARAEAATVTDKPEFMVICAPCCTAEISFDSVLLALL